MLETTRTCVRPPSAIADVRQAPARLNAAVRSLFGRRAPSARCDPAQPVRSVRAVWETGRGHRPPALEPDDESKQRAAIRHANAHAAYRSVHGNKQAALDAALAVVEAEVARLRGTVLTYGEALKALQVYGPDEETRRTAAAALHLAPERLRVAPPVPHFDGSSAGDRHG